MKSQLNQEKSTPADLHLNKANRLNKPDCSYFQIQKFYVIIVGRKTRFFGQVPPSSSCPGLSKQTLQPWLCLGTAQSILIGLPLNAGVS